MIDSIEARHARESAEQSRQSRELIAQTGPWLTTDTGGDQTIVIPSPNYHEEFSRILNAHGFRFEHSGVCPWWERDISKPVNGKTYTPAAWLDWAIRRYAWAWPKWEKDEGRMD